MNVFELFAKLTLDTSEYERGLKDSEREASSFASKLGGGLKNAAKVGAAAIGAATAAVGGFAASSVKVGANFDSAMSQVAATMGKTTDEIKDLREFAKKMGSETAFSASQAAEALNYMALAGYNSEKSMKMMPNVLNLAAAGGMDLARASDMVTDTQSALGLSMKETETLVNQMAKTASKSNTSVSQLGDAMLTIGATARGVKGGTQELSAVLGVLADNGIKASEGGTHLRNAILSLQTPTKDGTEALAKLGMTYDDMYDKSGNMKALPEIFLKMQDSMEGMTQQSKDAIISGLFNKTDLAAINALVGTSAERWNSLAAEIGNASGSAKEMADTQLDNLSGKITIFKSALEGAQIELSEGLTPALGDFVDFGASAMQKFTKNLKEDGLSAAIEGMGDSLAKGINLIVSKIPDSLKAGGTLLKGLVSGLSENAPELLQSGEKIIKILWSGIEKAAPVILKGGLDLMNKLSEGIKEGLPILINKGLNALEKLSGSLRKNAGKLIEAGLELIKSIAKGIIDGIPTMIKTIPTIISNFAGIINDNAPKVIASGVELIVYLAKGLIKAIPTLVANIPKILKAIWDVFMAFNWLNLGKNIITSIGNGIKKLATSIPNMFKQIGEKGLKTFLKTNWSALGQKVVSLIAKGITSFIENIPTSLTGIGKAAIAAFKALQWLDLGKNIISGIVKGLQASGSKIADSLVNLAKGALDSTKKFLHIKSPSKVFQEQVGKNIALGVASGIKNNSKYAKKSAQELAEATLQAAEFVAHSNKTLLGAGKAVNALSKTFSGNKSNLLSLASQWLENQKVYFNTSLKYEKDYWDAVRKQYKKGTQERIDADQKYFEARNALRSAKKSAKTTAKTLTKEYQKAMNEVQINLAKDIAAVQSTLVSNLAKVDEDLAKDLEKVSEDLAANLEKVNDDLSESVKKINDDLISNIDALTDKYNDSVNSRAKAIMNFTELFDSVSIDRAYSKDYLINTLDQQVKSIRDWDNELDSLASRLGKDNPLFQELQNMGMSSLYTLQEINKMSDEELQKYAYLYDQKSQAAMDRSLQENEDLKAQTESQIADMRSNARRQIEDAKKDAIKMRLELLTEAEQMRVDLKQTAEQERQTLRQEANENIQELKREATEQNNELTNKYKEGLKELARTVKTQGKSVGKEMVNGIKAGMNAQSNSLNTAANLVALSAVQSMKKTLGIKSPSKVMRETIGKNIDLGIAEGIEMYSGKVEDQYDGLFNFKDPDVTSGIATTVPTNNTSAVNNNSLDMTINVYGAQGQDVNELADEISQRISDDVYRAKAVWGMA